MSFADSVREELIALPIKRPCCRKALVCGLLTDAERDGKSLSLVFRSADIAGFATDQVRGTFSKQPELLQTTVRGRKGWLLRFSSPSAVKLLEKMEMCGASVSQDLPDTANAEVPANGEIDVDHALGFSCDSCRTSFLRGMFLALATLNDPHKSTHLEFFIRHPARTEFLKFFLTACGYPPGVIRRAGGDGLYYKDSGSVEDLTAMSGAGKTAMEMMNIRIEREIRNQENRATNCVAKNIEKSVSAASRQLAAIEKLALTGMLAQLPDSIRLTARLRAENPDATLEELRMLHEPPITKSGLNHRLQKLLDMADKTGL